MRVSQVLVAGWRGGGSCLLSSGHPFEGQDCTPGSVALVGSSSFGFWCTLHQVAVLLSLSGVKTEAWAPTSFLISPTLCLLLILPHKAITETRLIMHCKYLNCKLFGSWESTAINFRWPSAHLSREPFALPAAGPSRCWLHPQRV